MKIQKVLKKIIYSVLIVVFAGVLGLTFLSLSGFPPGFKIFVVETGSMEPNVPTGSLAFVTPSSEYKVGDVITFNTKLELGATQNFIVTHRINSIQTKDGETLYETKGDANKVVDPLLTDKINVIGKVNSHLPYLGYLIGFAKTQIGFTILIIIPSVILIYSEILNIDKEVKSWERRRKSKGLYMNLNNGNHNF